LSRRILQPSRGHPRPDCLPRGELFRNTGIFLQKLLKLLLSSHFRLRIASRVDRQSDTDKRIRRPRMVVKRYHPKPATLEAVMERALVIRQWKRVMRLVETRHVHHVGEQSPGVMFEPRRSFP